MSAPLFSTAAVGRIVDGLRDVGHWLSRPSNRLEQTFFAEIGADAVGDGPRGGRKARMRRKDIIMCDATHLQHSFS